MSKFRQYCGLTLLLLAVIFFQPLASGFYIEDDTFHGSLWIQTYTGLQLWKYFLVPFAITFGVFAMSFSKNLILAIAGITLSFGLVLYSFILPELMPGGIVEMEIGQDYLLALAGMFFLLNVSNAYQTYRYGAKQSQKTNKPNQDILDDSL
ncbi:MAG: hypothetical protein QNK23_10135 [Crocinitomicaceae bacterium]|nr:hypothetical protein [Crocinitomicaceae bacterium]